jgi:ferredoxin-NADP reductase
MPLITYTTTCLGKKLIAESVYEFRLEKPSGFTFTPGQYVLFHVPLLENPADVQTRAFSLASTPDDPDLLFVAKLIPGGRASRWIEEKLESGLAATFVGPFGKFVLDQASAKERIFVATGTGIAPFRSMILGAPQAMIDLVFGVKNEQQLFWTEQLAEWSRRYPHFHHHIVLSAPSPSWTGHRGWVQEATPLIVKQDFSRKSLYVCGNPQMTLDLKKKALGEWGMEKADVHVEGYI